MNIYLYSRMKLRIISNKIKSNMFSHSIKLVQLYKKNQMYKNKLAQSFTTTLNAIKFICYRIIIYTSITLLVRLTDEVRH